MRDLRAHVRAGAEGRRSPAPSDTRGAARPKILSRCSMRAPKRAMARGQRHARTSTSCLGADVEAEELRRIGSVRSLTEALVYQILDCWRLATAASLARLPPHDARPAAQRLARGAAKLVQRSLRRPTETWIPADATPEPPPIDIKSCVCFCTGRTTSGPSRRASDLTPAALHPRAVRVGCRVAGAVEAPSRGAGNTMCRRTLILGPLDGPSRGGGCVKSAKKSYACLTRISRAISLDLTRILRKSNAHPTHIQRASYANPTHRTVWSPR